MINPYIVLPVVFQMITAIAMIFFWGKTGVQKVFSIISGLVNLAIAIWLFELVWSEGIQIMNAGGWKAPFGITFVVDVFSAVMVLLTAICGVAVSIYSTGSIRNKLIKFGFFPILHFLLMGLNGAFLTGDIFNLYVWFEVVIISSFVMITLGGEKIQIEGGVKYVTMNLLASTIFLTAIALLYGLTGSLNMADLSLKVAEVENRKLVNITAVLFFIGFGIKSAIFPLYFWLPASYHAPPPAVSAIFAGLLTKVGIYAILRVFTLIFIPDDFMRELISWVAIFTILTGALGAIAQNNLREIFSYLIICHIGFMIAGLGIYTEIALVGVIFYLIHDIIVKTNLYMMAGLVYKIKGSYNIKRLGGFYKSYPKLSLLMAVPLFSLVGIPPLSGFWAKIFLIEGGFAGGNYIIVFAIILGSLITLIIIARIWSEVFWKESVELPTRDYIKYFHELIPSKRYGLVISIAILSLVSLSIGFGAEYIIRVSQHVAAELVDTSYYIEAVLGPQKTTLP
ncbi:MAG TPA: proton-conducting transporter membrane subunit [Cyclobacteriaceae bacterium]|nr:proton-conducting transporter membrane subunit [Cyclobacteriaceae bacterium]